MTTTPRKKVTAKLVVVDETTPILTTEIDATVADSVQQEGVVEPVSPIVLWQSLVTYDPDVVHFDATQPIAIESYKSIDEAGYAPKQIGPRAFMLHDDPRALYICVCFRHAETLMEHIVLNRKDQYGAGDSGEFDTGFCITPILYSVEAQMTRSYANRGLFVVNNHFRPQQTYPLHVVFSTTTQNIVIEQSKPMIRLQLVL